MLRDDHGRVGALRTDERAARKPKMIEDGFELERPERIAAHETARVPSVNSGRQRERSVEWVAGLWSAEGYSSRRTDGLGIMDRKLE